MSGFLPPMIDLAPNVLEDKITPTEVYALRYLMQENRLDSTDYDIQNLCRYLHIEKLEEMPRSMFPYFYAHILTHHPDKRLEDYLHAQLTLSEKKVSYLMDKIQKLEWTIWGLGVLLTLAAWIS